jgi:hypothetical protein
MPTRSVVAPSAATRRDPSQPEAAGNIEAIASDGLAKASLPDIAAIEADARLRPRRRHRDPLADGREMLELGFEATHRRRRRLGAGQRIEPPKQEMDAMHRQRAGLRPAGEDRVEMHRIAIPGNGGEPLLICLGEGSFR